MRRFDDECDAHRDWLAVQDADRFDLVRAAMEDILQGNRSSFAVLLAEREGLIAMAKVIS